PVVSAQSRSPAVTGRLGSAAAHSSAPAAWKETAPSMMLRRPMRAGGEAADSPGDSGAEPSIGWEIGLSNVLTRAQVSVTIARKPRPAADILTSSDSSELRFTTILTDRFVRP